MMRRFVLLWSILVCVACSVPAPTSPPTSPASHASPSTATLPTSAVATVTVPTASATAALAIRPVPTTAVASPIAPPVATTVPIAHPLRITDYRVIDRHHLWLSLSNSITETLLVTTDGGRRWTSQFTTTGMIRQFVFVDATQGWMILDEPIPLTADGRTNWSATQNAIFVTTDGGWHWSRQHQEAKRIESLSFVSPRRGWATSDGALLTTDDGGRSWRHQTTDRELHFIEFMDAQHGWGMSADGGAQDRQPSRTTDGGKTWMPIEDPPCDWYHGGGEISFISPKIGWGMCNWRPVNEGPRYIYKTEDGGRQWHPIVDPPASAEGIAVENVQSLFFLDKVHGWFVTFARNAENNQWQTEVWFTTEGGYRWVIINKPTSQWTQLYFDTLTHGYVLAGQEYLDYDMLLQTWDGGRSWKQLYPTP